VVAFPAAGGERERIAGMSGIARFLSAGLADIDRRIGRVTAPDVTHESWLLQVLASGALAGLVVRVADVGRRAAASSKMFAWARDVAQPWQHTPSGVRRQALGRVIFVATAVHVALVLWAGAPPGWWWLILPGVAATVAIVLQIGALERQRPGAR
jgi:hypothetical protein